MYTPTIFFLEKLMTQLIDHAVAGPFSGVLDGVYCGLGQTPTGTLNPGQGLSAITEASYDGYARLPMTWKPPYLKSNNAVVMQSDGLYFAPTGAVTSNTITSMFIADALTAGNLLLSELIPGGPIGMSGTGTAFSLAILFQMLTGNNFGDCVLIQ